MLEYVSIDIIGSNARVYLQAPEKVQNLTEVKVERAICFLLSLNIWDFLTSRLNILKCLSEETLFF